VDLSKNCQVSNFTKIHLVGAEYFHADRVTDMRKPVGPFHNFAHAHKNSN